MQVKIRYNFIRQGFDNYCLFLRLFWIEYKNFFSLYYQ